MLQIISPHPAIPAVRGRPLPVGEVTKKKGQIMTHIYKTISMIVLMAALTACSNSEAPQDITEEIVAEEPTGMNAGSTEPVDMDYTRISFAKGAVSAQVPGNLAGFDDENEFVIDVAAGQVMSVKKAVDDEERISLAIINPLGENVTDMDAGCNGNKTVDITESGDYSIRVTQCMKADPWNNDYILDVTVK